MDFLINALYHYFTLRTRTHTYTEPMLHVVCTAVGFYVGYLAHRYEENSEERVQKLLEKHRHVPPHDHWAQTGKGE